MKKNILIQDVINHLESLAPLSLQENYDNSGLLIGKASTRVQNILLTLDCTEKVVEEAIDKKAGLIIAHHPIIFNGIKKLTGDNYTERVVIKCIQNNIALYACHTNLDNIKEGVNKKIAEKIGLNNLSILQPKSNQLAKLFFYAPKGASQKIKQELFKNGFGKIGNYSECSFSVNGIGTFMPNKKATPYIGQKNKTSKLEEEKIEIILPAHKKNQAVALLKANHPYEDVAYELILLNNLHQEIGSGMIGELDKAMSPKAFLEHIGKKMKAKSIKYTPSKHKKIKKIAICGGSGAFLLNQAKRAGAQAYISSDFKYHEYFDAENEISIIDIGHYESEQYTPQLFYEILSKKFPKFALHLSKVNTNPINYFIWQK